MELSAKELRYMTSEALKATENGEEVIITYHGKPKAKLIPFPESKKKKRSKDLPAFGMWADREDLDDVNAFVREMRKPRYEQ